MVHFPPFQFGNSRSVSHSFDCQLMFCCCPRPRRRRRRRPIETNDDEKAMDHFLVCVYEVVLGPSILVDQLCCNMVLGEQAKIVSKNEQSQCGINVESLEATISVHVSFIRFHSPIDSVLIEALHYRIAICPVINSSSSFSSSSSSSFHYDWMMGFDLGTH